MRASVERRRDTGFSCRPVMARKIHGWWAKRAMRAGLARFGQLGAFTAPAMFDFSIMRRPKSPSLVAGYLWRQAYVRRHGDIIKFHPSAARSGGRDNSSLVWSDISP